MLLDGSAFVGERCESGCESAVAFHRNGAISSFGTGAIVPVNGEAVDAEMHHGFGGHGGELLIFRLGLFQWGR